MKGRSGLTVILEARFTLSIVYFDRQLHSARAGSVHERMLKCEIQRYYGRSI